MQAEPVNGAFVRWAEPQQALLDLGDDMMEVPESTRADGLTAQPSLHSGVQGRTGSYWNKPSQAGGPYLVEYKLTFRTALAERAAVRAKRVRNGSGNANRWYGAFTDQIIETREILARSRRELEREIALRTRERDRMWRISRDLLVVVDGDGTMTAVNGSWTHVLGWEERELVGRPLVEFTHPEDLQATVNAFERIFFESPLKRPYEFRLRHRDGSYRWIAWMGALEDGKLYASGRDTTADRAHAAALAIAEEELRQAQKMQAIGQLTGGIAHDFNNLLAVITMSLEVVKRKVALGHGDVDRHVTAGLRSVKQAASLTHRLLSFARRQVLDPRPTEIVRLVRGMEDLIRSTMGPSVDFEVVTAGQAWPVSIDRNQLENALLNLCINARDAMPNGGHLTIRAANEWLGERDAADLDLPCGAFVTISVSDTGSGMPAEVVARAFDPFFTTKPVGKGTGLGLSMVYGFVRQSGGQLRIESVVDRGTCMTMYLPRHAAGENDTAEAAPVEEVSGHGQTVLLVEDEADLRMLLGVILEDLGYTVLKAATAQAALVMLGSDARIDFLISDIGLRGGMSGTDMAAAAQALRPALKVLFITGFVGNAVTGDADSAACTGYLLKPFTKKELEARLKDLS